MIRRMRMFAGPNGSGKSTVKSVIEDSMLGYYLNPDDIEKTIKRDGYFDVRGLNLPMSEPEIIRFFQSHPLFSRSDEADFIHEIRFVQREFIDFANVPFLPECYSDRFFTAKAD